MRLFVTGGTGFIGSHFLCAAVSAGHEVIALRRTEMSRPRIELPVQPRWLTAEMAAVEVAQLKSVDVLVHLAAAGVSPKKATWQELFQVNVIESLQLWHRAADAGVPRLVICGSCFEYGDASENYDWIPPDCPLRPVTTYGASKAAASMAALALAAEREIELAILRPFHVYGEGQHADNFWPSLRRAAQSGNDFPMTAGDQLRDFIPVERVAAAFLHSCTQEDLIRGKGFVLNVGSGQTQTLSQFAIQWWEAWGAKGQLRFGALPYRHSEVMRYVPSVTEYAVL
jgi:nucleoside-diphosphate-sugar epimerase